MPNDDEWTVPHLTRRELLAQAGCSAVILSASSLTPKTMSCLPQALHRRGLRKASISVGGLPETMLRVQNSKVSKIRTGARLTCRMTGALRGLLMNTRPPAVPAALCQRALVGTARSSASALAIAAKWLYSNSTASTRTATFGLMATILVTGPMATFRLSMSSLII